MDMAEIVMKTHSSFQPDTALTRDQQLLIAAMGLCGESGEFIEHVKKFWEHGRVLDKDKMTLELADILYYVQLACFSLDTDFEELTDLLHDKLERRYTERFK